MTEFHLISHSRPWGWDSSGLVWLFAKSLETDTRALTKMASNTQPKHLRALSTNALGWAELSRSSHFICLTSDGDLPPDFVQSTRELYAMNSWFRARFVVFWAQSLPLVLIVAWSTLCRKSVWVNLRKPYETCAHLRTKTYQDRLDFCSTIFKWTRVVVSTLGTTIRRYEKWIS